MARGPHLWHCHRGNKAAEKRSCAEGQKTIQTDHREDFGQRNDVPGVDAGALLPREVWEALTTHHHGSVVPLDSHTALVTSTHVPPLHDLL